MAMASFSVSVSSFVPFLRAPSTPPLRGRARRAILFANRAPGSSTRKPGPISLPISGGGALAVVAIAVQPSLMTPGVPTHAASSFGGRRVGV